MKEHSNMLHSFPAELQQPWPGTLSQGNKHSRTRVPDRTDKVSAPVQQAHAPASRALPAQGVTGLPFITCLDPYTSSIFMQFILLQEHYRNDHLPPPVI